MNDVLKAAEDTAYHIDKQKAVQTWDDAGLPIRTRRALIHKAIADIDLEIANLQHSKAALVSHRLNLK